MRKTTLFKTILLLCALVVGGGNFAWAEETTIASWGKVSISANTAIKASDGDANNKNIAQFSSTKAMTSSGTYCFYGSSAGGAVITFSNLNLSDYTDITMTFYTRASQQGTMQIAYSSDGTNYTNLNAPSITKSEDQKTSEPIPNTAKYIKLTHSASTGSLYFGTIVIKGTKAVSATALEVKSTSTNKLNYKVGETLDLTGLVLSATIDGTITDITEGYTAKIGETTVTSGTTVLNTVGVQTVTFKYGGQECTQTIHVGSLQNIAIATSPTKTTYNEGETFDPAGMAVNATFSDEETTATTWTEDVTASCTFSPTTSTVLHPANTSVTVSYTWNNVEKTATQAITVSAGPIYTVAFNAEGGTCETSSLTESSWASGVTLPTATISTAGWVFAGWATATVSNTTTRPTLYAAGTTYYPTENVTLHAVYRLAGVDDTKYKRANGLSEILSASNIAIVSSGKILDAALGNVTAPSETNGMISAPTNDNVWAISGNDTDGYTLTSSQGKTLGIDNIPSSNGNVKTYSTSASNNKWFVVVNTSGDNMFTIRNKNTYSVGKISSLEYYSSAWKLYTLAESTFSGNTSVALKIYVPVQTAYSSNPTAIISPTVAFENDGTTLYLDGTTTYTNTATVTGVSKAITYTSSDEDVATVNANGVVTAQGIGTATITASVEEELGVSSAASDSYDVVVKSTTTIAGIKALTSSSTAVSFSADLTDAVVTYVNGSHAYIQDASGAVYASCGSSLTAGQKINGAVSGSVKAAYKIDEITSLNVSEATVTTDGVIPAAEVKTLAQIKAGDYDGKLVTVNAATVKTGMNDATSGGVITDDEETTTFNIYAPNKLTLNATEIGNFTGFVSIYNGNTYRLNLYEASQYEKTQNVATAQTLTFESYVIELDEETDNYDNFAGQTVSGAQGTVSYALTGDEIGTVDSSTGIVTLNGTYGTATITATAAAANVTENGVITPYTETTKSYTVTVYPRYTSTFSINGEVTVVRQATHGAAITVPTPAATIDEYSFVGWKASSAIAIPTDEAPAMVTPPTTPTSNETYYAVYALAAVSGSGGSYVLDYESETNLHVDLAYATEKTYTATDGGVWVIHAYNSISGNTGGLQINTGKGASIKVPTCPGPITTIGITGSIAKTVGFSTTADGTAIISGSKSTSQTLDFAGKSLFDGFIIPVDGNIVITNIVVNYGPVTTYSGYCTSLTEITLTTTNNMAGWRSFYDASQAYEVDENTTIYVVRAKSETVDKVVLTDAGTNAIPAATPVILKTTASDYQMTLTKVSTAAALGNNLLAVTNGTDDVEGYRLGYNATDGVAFFHYTPATAPEAGIVYIPVDGVYVSDEGRGLTISFEDNDPSGIMNVNVNHDDNYYDLRGRRVQKPGKGLYILNGKKVVVK